MERVECPKAAWRQHQRHGLAWGLSLVCRECRGPLQVPADKAGLSVCEWLALLGRAVPTGLGMVGLRRELRHSCGHTHTPTRALTHCQPAQVCTEMNPDAQSPANVHRHTGRGLHTTALPCAQRSPGRPEALRGCSHECTSTGMCRYSHTLGHSHTATLIIAGQHMGHRP